MLQRKHFLFESTKGRVYPDRLMKKKHAHYLPLTENMLQIYRNGSGETRRELHRRVEQIFLEKEDCPVRRIQAFCKLLDDASEYDHKRTEDSYVLRRKVFEYAAPFHPLVSEKNRLFEYEENEIKKKIIKALDEQGLLEKSLNESSFQHWRKKWKEIEARLFSDVPEFHRLSYFHGYPSPESFLARYNIAQIQVALYFAVDLVIRTEHDLKKIIRCAKLFGLMHTIRKIGKDRYQIRLDGPSSLMRQTRIYGVALARFLPALISCQGWKIHARLRMPPSGWWASLELSEKDGLHSENASPQKFDSKVEENFFKKWGDKPRKGWTLKRETEILSHYQKVFFPDFVFYHENGRRIYMEIVGFWTPEYLEAKAKTLRQFQNNPIILAVHESLVDKLPSLPLPILAYKKNLKINWVLKTLSEN